MGELDELFLKVHNKLRDRSWIYGRLGRQDGASSYTLRVSGKAGWVHVRLGSEGKGGVTQAKNEGVPLHPNLPIKMLRENGILVVHGMDTRGGFTVTDGGMPLVNHWWMHDRLGPDPGYISGLAFLPLAVTPTNPPDMTVTVQQGWYRYGGVRTVWQTGATAGLSSYVPAVTGLQHFVIVCLDRTDNTLAIVDGADGSSATGGVPFSASDVLAISVDDAYWPLAAVRFYYGQSVIRAADIFMDLRLWGGEQFGDVSSGTLSSGWGVDYDAIIPTGKDAFIPGTVSIADGASLTVDGDLYVV